jgi:DNA-binding NarL/FixJ family response regulator
MPELNGIEATRQVLAEDPSARVIALSMHSDRQIVTEALRAGAKGYLLKNSAASELLAAIRAVMSGRVYLSPSVAHVVVTDLVNPSGRPAPSNPSAFSSLTPREREVLQLLAEGKTNKEIAASLDIGVKTVETHRAQVMEKLNLRTVAQLTKYAIRNGMTSIES